MTTEDLTLEQLADWEEVARSEAEEKNASLQGWLDVDARAEADSLRAELAAVREAWEKERAGYDETARVLGERAADAHRRADVALHEADRLKEIHRVDCEQLAHLAAELGLMRPVVEAVRRMARFLAPSGATARPYDRDHLYEVRCAFDAYEAAHVGVVETARGRLTFDDDDDRYRGHDPLASAKGVR